MIEANHICKNYGDRWVVDNVSLHIPSGKVTSIIGPNGAGKSTLLSMLSRLMPLSSGQVLIDGLDVATTPSDVVARRIAILRQDNHMTSRLTVRDLVAFGRHPHSRGRPTMRDCEHIERSIAFMDLEPLAERFLDELSGGQRQRAFVAMVLCQDTDYVLLDEPLNSLDLKHAVSMLRRLRRAADELGKTVVVVMHDINFASRYSDQIVAMRDGKVLYQASPEDIIHPEVLRSIYDIEVKVHCLDGCRIAVFQK